MWDVKLVPNLFFYLCRCNVIRVFLCSSCGMFLTGWSCWGFTPGSFCVDTDRVPVRWAPGSAMGPVGKVAWALQPSFTLCWFQPKMISNQQRGRQGCINLTKLDKQLHPPTSSSRSHYTINKASNRWYNWIKSLKMSLLVNWWSHKPSNPDSYTYCSVCCLNHNPYIRC